MTDNNNYDDAELIWRNKNRSPKFMNESAIEIETIGQPQQGSWTNLLFQGDNLYSLSKLVTEKFTGLIRLIYIDPPFGIGRDPEYPGHAGNSENRAKAFKDNWGNQLTPYLNMLYPRIALMKELLAEDGSIYVHLDYHISHYVKIIMDEIFGRNNLVNQIIWQRTGAHNDPKAFGRNYDIILFYQKSEKRLWNDAIKEYDKTHIKRYFRQDPDGRWYRLNNPTGKGYLHHYRDFGSGPMFPPRDRHWSVTQQQIDEWIKENRIVFTSSGYPFVKKYLDELRGKQLQSIWTDLIPPRSSSEITGFPTQKPEKLLERIIKASTNPQDIVADFFCGSGTSLVVSEKMGRRWIGCDLSENAIRITRKRLLEISNIRPFKIIKVAAQAIKNDYDSF